MNKAELARYIAERDAAVARRKALMAPPRRVGERSQAQITKDRLIAEYNEKLRALNDSRRMAGDR